MKRLPQILRELRQEIGLSQDAVSQWLGISLQAYAAYEQERSEPKTTTLIRLAALYDIQPDMILPTFYPGEFPTIEPPELDMKRSKAIMQAKINIKNLEANLTALTHNPLLQ